MLLDGGGGEVHIVYLGLVVFRYLYPCMLVVDKVSESLWLFVKERRGDVRRGSDYFGTMSMNSDQTYFARLRYNKEIR